MSGERPEIIGPAPFISEAGYDAVAKRIALGIEKQSGPEIGDIKMVSIAVAGAALARALVADGVARDFREGCECVNCTLIRAVDALAPDLIREAEAVRDSRKGKR